MDREYLEDYERKEFSEFERLVKKKIRQEAFSFEKDRYPPNTRFVNLQKPVALATSWGPTETENFWVQVPLCGSLIFPLSSLPRSLFERFLFKISDIPKVIDFIKETGRLQIGLQGLPTEYEGLDYLDPFFKELTPPVLFDAPLSILGNEKEIQMAANAFYTLADVRYSDFLWEKAQQVLSRSFQFAMEGNAAVYTFLKLSHYAHPIVENIENFLIDEPAKAFKLLLNCGDFIYTPFRNLCSNLINFEFERIKAAQDLPLVYQPQEIRFPCEIGKFLLKKLTYAPQGLDACKELVYHYDAYDLRKVAESLNDAIVANHPDAMNKSAEELSDILDNVWKDPTIPRRVKGLKIGMPLSMAAIGSVAAGPIGAAGGFLAGLGFNVAHKFIDVEAEGLSEKLAKWRTKSYQANVYDFKKKYKVKIAHP